MDSDTENGRCAAVLKIVQPGRALVVGFFMGGAIGAGLMLASAFFVSVFHPIIYVPMVLMYLPFAVILGSATGGIFGLMTYPFVRKMDIPKVVFCLAWGTFLFGLIANIVTWFGWGVELPLFSWPAGMLGYVVAFLFRHELVAFVTWWQVRKGTGRTAD